MFWVGMSRQTLFSCFRRKPLNWSLRYQLKKDTLKKIFIFFYYYCFFSETSTNASECLAKMGEAVLTNQEVLNAFVVKDIKANSVKKVRQRSSRCSKNMKWCFDFRQLGENTGLLIRFLVLYWFKNVDQIHIKFLYWICFDMVWSFRKLLNI